LAGIPSRIGYAREGRSIFLTEKLYPPRLPNGKYKPTSMLDYYLAIASGLGCDIKDITLELTVEPNQQQTIISKIPELARPDGPVVVLVPGGSFGPSKCWPAERYAKTADRLIEKYNAAVIVSASSDLSEKQTANRLCSLSKNKLINLAENPVGLGELKGIFSLADLVITNDTGPRHIAIALKRKVITLFGPNDPAWTETGYENEIEIVGKAPCSPCRKPNCDKDRHLCMESISVETVCEAAKRLLENKEKHKSINKEENTRLEKNFYLDDNFKEAFTQLGLTSTEKIFSFKEGKNLVKDNLARYRSRVQFEINSPATKLFLKRYDRPPILSQLKNWLAHRRRISCAMCNVETAEKLAVAGISVPNTISYGEKWGLVFEKRSFVITEQIPNASSLESKLPACFDNSGNTENIKTKRDFIRCSADFVRRFHDAGFRHRDLYLSHIFYDNNNNFYLIDLARTFKPLLLMERFRVKDIAQLHYSAPAKNFSATDRLRFYLRYSKKTKLANTDKSFIKKVVEKSLRMAKHDKKHGRAAPFLMH
jgi:heptosyltransferase-2